MEIDWIELVGYAGTVFTIFAYGMRHLVPLRICAILSSLAFLLWAADPELSPGDHGTGPLADQLLPARRNSPRAAALAARKLAHVRRPRMMPPTGRLVMTSKRAATPGPHAHPYLEPRGAGTHDVHTPEARVRWFRVPSALGRPKGRE